MAHSHDVPVMVDATVSTPYLTKSIKWGADIVIHSMTKYIGGHGNSLGGMIVDAGKFPWADHADRYPMLVEPEPAYHGVQYTEAFGPAAFIARARTFTLGSPMIRCAPASGTPASRSQLSWSSLSRSSAARITSKRST